MKRQKITVVGSLNMDLVTLTTHVPHMGETVHGQEFRTIPGGKGANQAVAAARLGADVNMIGCVGDDVFGQSLTANMEKEGVSMSGVEPVTGSSGTATIIVSEGDNCIVVVPGANFKLTPERVDKHKQLIIDSDVLLVQLEVPLAAVSKAMSIAKENGVKVILNPAPIQELPKEVVEMADYITPNEHEMEVLKHLGSECLLERVIVTKGEKGVSFYQNGQQKDIQAYSVQALDSTGAGDAFNGGLAVAISQGMTLDEACKFGNAVAALSVTKIGAQTGMPTSSEVSDFRSSRE